jgi:molybdenum cofactor cytidylyltransferase
MIVGVLLAAGSARRFGAQKMLASVALERDGESAPVVRLSAERLLEASLGQTIVVLGSEHEAVRAALAELPVSFVVNERYAEGISTSVKSGISAALALGDEVDAVAIALGDQPTIGPHVLPALIERFARETVDGIGYRSIVGPRFQGVRGNPVIIGRGLLPELLEVTGDRGARDVIARNEASVKLVDFDEPMPLDIDTPADLAALVARRSGRR